MTSVQLIYSVRLSITGRFSYVRDKTGEIDAAAVRKLGLDPDRLSQVKQVIEQDTAKGLYDGAVFIVARHGTIVVHEAVGSTDLAKKRPAKLDDYFFIMSLTKQMTVVRVLMDIEKGSST